MEVPFNSLLPQSQSELEETVSAVRSIVEDGVYFFGPQTDLFESEFAGYLGAETSVSVGNGTDALEIALRALGVGADDLVICVANAGGYSTVAIRQVGAKPVYVDVEPNSLQMLPESLVAGISSARIRPAAVIVTHLYGALGDIEAIVAICEEHEIPLIEDCAQAIGVTRNRTHAGNFGTIATFSFYPTKNLGGIGDSGSVVTNNSALAESVRALAQYGWKEKYIVRAPYGRNSRMDEVQAAVLRIRLRNIDLMNARRAEIYQIYSQISPALDFVHRNHKSFNAHLAVLRVQERHQVMNIFEQHGIQTAIHYPILDSAQSGFPASSQTLENSEAGSQRVISVPCHPGLSSWQVELVCSVLHKIASSGLGVSNA